ncbi:Alkylhydroperoxidase AhpD core [Rhabdaerophilaceae bacterium]
MVGKCAFLTLGKGTLPATTRERIALAVAEINGCDHCLLAHTFIGKNMAKLDDAEMTANRSGASNDPKADTAVQFATKVARERGQVTEDDVLALKVAEHFGKLVVNVAANG